MNDEQMEIVTRLAAMIAEEYELGADREEELRFAISGVIADHLLNDRQRYPVTGGRCVNVGLVGILMVAVFIIGVIAGSGI